MNLKNYQEIQAIAKRVLSELGDLITSESTEKTIATTAILLMGKYGVRDSWYHNTPALVLLGSRSCLSVSGRNYSPSGEVVGTTNLVTVDLSPSQNYYWGDCARSFCIESGEFKPLPESTEFTEGLNTEKELHRRMLEFITPETRFLDLYDFGNEQIQRFGYENLDFLSNLGHTIETNRSDRKFIDKKCSEKIGTSQLFTLEPHIRRKGGEWGFKHENIYYLDPAGNAVEL